MNKPSKEEVQNIISHLLNKLHIFSKVDESHVKDTPKRIANMLIDELFTSLYEDPPEITTFKNNQQNNQVILIKNLEVRSMCAHHWMPFYGFAHIAYVPDETVAGLSKFGRVVDYFSRKPQIQEILAKEIIEYLDQQLKPKAIGIYVSCTHMCMRHRGLESDHSVTDNIYIIGKVESSKTLVSQTLQNLIST